MLIRKVCNLSIQSLWHFIHQEVAILKRQILILFVTFRPATLGILSYLLLRAKACVNIMDSIDQILFQVRLLT